MVILRTYALLNSVKEKAKCRLVYQVSYFSSMTTSGLSVKVVYSITFYFLKMYNKKHLAEIKNIS